MLEVNLIFCPGYWPEPFLSLHDPCLYLIHLYTAHIWSQTRHLHIRITLWSSKISSSDMTTSLASRCSYEYMPRTDVGLFCSALCWDLRARESVHFMSLIQRPIPMAEICYQNLYYATVSKKWHHILRGLRSWIQQLMHAFICLSLFCLFYFPSHLLSCECMTS